MPRPSENAWDRAPSSPAAPSRPAFGAERLARARGIGDKTVGSILIAILGSAIFHSFLFGGVAVWSWMHPPPAPPERVSPVEIVDLTQLPKMRARLDSIRNMAKLDEPVFTPPRPNDPKGQIVDLPDSKDAAPDRAKYLASSNHRADEETSSREQVMAPKVLSDSFKGMGADASAGSAKFEGEGAKTGQGTGHDEKTERLVKNGDTRSTITDHDPGVFDPFGLRVQPHEAPTPTPEHGDGGTADQNVTTTAAGGGSKVAMAGAPSNDYLPGVKVSDRTNLNAKEFVFASFWNRMKNTVGPLWEKHLRDTPPDMHMQKRDYMTRVNIVLSADGTVDSVDITQHCGIDAWDRAVKAAFEEAGAFPNPPAGLVDADGKIHMDNLGFIVSLTGEHVQYGYADPGSENLFPGINQRPNRFR